MNNQEPRHQNWQNGGGTGHDGYVANGGYGTQVPPAPARTASHRGAWIGAGATLVAAVIGVVGTYLVNTDNDTKATPPAAAAQGPDSSKAPESQAPATTGESAPATPTATTSELTTPPATPPATPPTTAPAKPAGTVEWQGALAITYTDSKDLDSAPPVESEINAENDFSVYPFGDHMLQPEGDTKALVWKDASKVPAYADCAGVVDTLGTSTEMKLKTGLVVCARTNDGRLARLTVKELTGQSSDATGIFDVVVWSR
ncbi:hypothetical protein ACI2LO_00405 [Streptomyces sp. NPDC033754]|uniref:hypothetical protein n=1 Tax=unclassified Streptomyces TaxID=2593676 RepID=UPI0033FE870D